MIYMIYIYAYMIYAHIYIYIHSLSCNGQSLEFRGIDCARVPPVVELRPGSDTEARWYVQL